MSSSSASVSFFFLLSLIFAIANAQVPANETFKFVNEGGLGEYFNEYNANYRMSGIYNDPFQLGFYNTTPNAFTLALRLGIKKQEPVFRWVWEANRGKPVRENAVFSLGADGNLVLAEADGTVVWQSNTANKGIVGFELLPNGNMVLRDSKGKFIWQSFDYPTDTLLVGQSLRVGRVTKLVSRLSVKENVDGPYSFVMEPRRLAFYYKRSNVPRPILYYTFPFSYTGLKNLTLKSSPGTRHYELTLDSSDGNNFIMDRPKYNSTISFLRLGIDGNLRVFTYSQEVDFLPEEERFTLFGKISRGNDGINWGNECQMPDRCGKLGLCEDEQCVACPTENGLIGWSKENYHRMSGIYNDLFNLGFYNTTPNAYTLALLFGSMDRKAVFRWVWEANRGKPVRENAVLSFGTDGNLVLAEADGTVVWQSNTANKGVVRFELLSSGNMVLRDSKGKFIWQSFDYPTDTLLVGQSLRVSRVTKLISRLSIKENVDGPHSFVMEPKRLALYYKSSNGPRPVVYYTFPISYKGLKNLTLKSSPETMYKLTLVSSDGNSLVLDRPKYDSTISFLRLSMDGNLRIFTFPREVDWLPEEGRFWLPEEERFTLFGKDSRGSNAINWENECQMPDKCGKLGLCEDNQCIACPTEKGLIGWSKECEPKQVNFCGTKDFHYYKLESVEHYMCRYNDGIESITIEDCARRCSSNCRCVAYFYDTDLSRCWTAFDLKTLSKVPDSKIVGFLKFPNNYTV
ncbi:hypothetical protein WN944_014265 [Citrus x changshan-huyou]|uniref:Bulb-type lectin domain-containing protein n=1 Tax=Citrus x changshan-huyou TaxID=2935761 RepID=A0AAP0M825_9ROSI